MPFQIIRNDITKVKADDPITPELLEDGTFLKRATEICNRNRTQLNLIKLARILRDSWVWVPCTAIFRLFTNFCGIVI